MKIIFNLSTLEKGGAEKIGAFLCNKWQEQGHDVVLVSTFSEKRQQAYPLNSNIKIINFSDIIENMNFGIYRSFFFRALLLRKIFKKENPDFIVSFLPNVNIMCLLAKIGLGIPVIISERVDTFVMPLPILLKILMKLSYPLTDKLIVQTNELAEKFKTRPRLRAKIAVIPNPILDFQYSRKIKLTNEPKILLSYGRIVLQKRIDRLIVAFDSLGPNLNNWELHIYGDGPEKQKLQQLALSKRSAKKIKFFPHVTNIDKLLTSSDAFAMTSEFEGFPNSLIEAMNSGLPCLAVDCPSGPKEITCNGKNAILTKNNDPLDLIYGLEKLLSLDKNITLLAKRGQESVRARYSSNLILKYWDEIFQQMLAQSR